MPHLPLTAYPVTVDALPSISIIAVDHGMPPEAVPVVLSETVVRSEGWPTASLYIVRLPSGRWQAADSAAAEAALTTGALVVAFGL